MSLGLLENFVFKEGLTVKVVLLETFPAQKDVDANDFFHQIDLDQLSITLSFDIL